MPQLVDGLRRSLLAKARATRARKAPDRTDEQLGDPRSRAALDALHDRTINYDAVHADRLTPEAGWRHETRCQALPSEAPGPPVPGGSFEIARELMCDYEFADPKMVRAVYHHDTPLEDRDMLLVVRFLFLRFHVGVRVGGVFEQTRTVDGRQVHVWGWNYRTLRGHFEMGEMNYELWKWIDNGEVEFRTRGVWRPGGTRNPLVRIGFRVFGPRQRERFYASACRRMVALTTARLQRGSEERVPRASERIEVKPISQAPSSAR